MSYLTVFSGLDTCVCGFLVEDLTLFFSLVFDLIMAFLLYSVYPLSFCDKKGEYFFVFGPGMYFQTGQVLFLS
jgi:hypothetical protein